MGQNYKSINYIQFIINKKNEERYIKNGGAYMASTHNLEPSTSNKEKLKLKN